MVAGLLAAWEPSPASASHASPATPTQGSTDHDGIGNSSPVVAPLLKPSVESLNTPGSMPTAKHYVDILEAVPSDHQPHLLSPSQTSTAVCSRNSSMAKHVRGRVADAGCNTIYSNDYETKDTPEPGNDIFTESFTHSSELTASGGDSDDDDQPLATILPGFRRNRLLSDQPTAVQLRLRRQQYGSSHVSRRPATWSDPLWAQMLWDEDVDPALTFLDPLANRSRSSRAIDDPPPRYDEAVSTSAPSSSPSSSPAYTPRLPALEESSQPLHRSATRVVVRRSTLPLSTHRGRAPVTCSNTLANEHPSSSNVAPLRRHRPVFQRSTSSLQSGASNLPPYQCTIQKEGQLLVKVEFDDYNKRPKHRSWQ
ncbi:hypothetical protein H4R34_003206 [Dimargaris verticillata]|uniref:Uncharacterized protein n=1 Tax=Dimargaris verticillata TaxID=2761393 RepID=A0A9W8EDD1_9FUNG|nr:hypothetical protein H4R34_003206 [Dimargaris verticillata]